MRHPREAHAALMPLLAILRQRGVIADLPTPSGPIFEELSRYDAYMLDTRGLASGTRSVRLRIIERLLVNSSRAILWICISCSRRTSAASSPSSWNYATRSATR